METFTDIFPTLDDMNEWKNKLFGSIEDVNNDEYVALMGRYASSHIRYGNRYQFMCQFFALLSEALPRLRAKLKINTELRSLESDDALSGEENIVNQARNPDTEPTTEDYAPLPYVNAQTAQKTKLSKVAGLYNWKHSVGGQAYIEFLDAFQKLFKLIHTEDITVYAE